MLLASTIVVFSNNDVLGTYYHALTQVCGTYDIYVGGATLA